MSDAAATPPPLNSRYADLGGGSARSRNIGEGVLRREALLRSFRWVFLGKALNDIALAWFTNIAISTRLTGGDLARAQGALITTLIIGVTIGLVGFYAFSAPRKWTGTFMTILCVVLGFAVTCGGLGTAMDMGDAVNFGAARMALPSVATWIENLAFLVLYLCLRNLIRTGAGTTVYSNRGIDYFSSPASPRRAENPFVAVGFFFFLLIRWGIGLAMGL